MDPHRLKFSTQTGRRRRRNPHAKRISQRPDEGIGPYRGKPEWGGGGGKPPPYGVGKDEADGETSLLNF